MSGLKAGSDGRLVADVLSRGTTLGASDAGLLAPGGSSLVITAAGQGDTPEGLTKHANFACAAVTPSG